MDFTINKILRDDFLRLKEEDLMFITNPGRMGDEDGSTFIIRQDNEYKIYRVDDWMYGSNDINFISEHDTAKQFPLWLDTMKNRTNKDYKGKYKWIYMGFGNGLSIDNSIYDEYIPFLEKRVEEYLKDEEDKENLRSAAIFNVWLDAFNDMVNKDGD